MAVDRNAMGNIYQIDGRGLDLQDDPENMEMYSEEEPELEYEQWRQLPKNQAMRQRFYTPDSIEPERIRRMDPMEYTRMRRGAQYKHIANNDVLISHDLKWQPGVPGKGWVLADGSVWTWPVDPESRNKPWHMDKSFTMKQRGLYPMRIGNDTGSFEIQPDGTVHRLGRPVPPEFMDAILGADPRLKNPDDDPWRFSNVIPMDRWAWIG
jgi:hypothetical protein